MELDATAAAEPASPTAGAASDPAPLDATATAAGSARARAMAGDDRSVGPGTRLAHFRVERLLGEGGMGQVWLATDLALDRPVALKVLPAHTAGDADRRDRLVREARAQARLIHPNVCHIYFIGEDEGRLFFAMEYVDGETLAARLERGPLPPDEALELTRMAAAGLRAADQAGFTHRDVKPSNLMIDRNGTLKVMDFGLVSASPGTVDGDAPVAASALVGTPLYMAPEQGRGEVVDRRADIYALGATLHHMISGAPPFVGETAADLMSRHQTEVRPKLSAMAPLRRSASLADDVVARMMAKRPADRFADYDQLLDALARASTMHTRPAGLFVRGMAAFIDMVVSGLLVVVPMQLLLPGVDDGVAMLVVWAFLYPIAIRRWGATPGRAALDLELMRHDGPGKVGYVQAQTRFLAQYGPMALGSGLSELGRVIEVGPIRIAGIGLVMAGFVYVALEALHASARSVDKRPRWDRLAGTRTCYRRRATPRRDDRKPA